MQMAPLAATPNLTVTRPTASYSDFESALIQDTFSSMETPEALPKALEALKMLGQSSNEHLTKQVHVALAAVLAAAGGPLALTFCKCAFAGLQEPGLNLAAFANRLAEPLNSRTHNPLMFAISQAVAPHYGMAPGTREVVDDLVLFMSPVHDNADAVMDGTRVACLKRRLDQLSQLDDDHSYAGYLVDATREGKGGPQVGEVAGRTFVGGVLVRRKG
jgi:hypothetical protein